tara:strand:- start:730 stop:957 length:228 start_codon:yes stop_codon:yes gene_type:complete
MVNKKYIACGIIGSSALLCPVSPLYSPNNLSLFMSLGIFGVLFTLLKGGLPTAPNSSMQKKRVYGISDLPKPKKS